MTKREKLFVAKPSYYDSFQVLLLQLADEGRGSALLGDSVARAWTEAEPFLFGKEFPSVYFELPLAGDPFLDLTMLYENVDAGTRIRSRAADGVGSVIDWFADAHDGLENVCFGFELDTSKPELPRAALHFQPRSHTELVEPFCVAAGEPDKAQLYLDLAARMPDGWPLSFFGMFQGRPGSPLRVCGYMGDAEKSACTDEKHLMESLGEIGFTAFDDQMLSRISELLAIAPGTVDFQFDVYPDGSIGDVFAVDVQFEIEQPDAVCESFASGPAARVMELLERWGAADERWRIASGAAFARGLNVRDDDGAEKKLAFTLMPQWVKVRWCACELQASKLYYFGSAEIVNERDA